MRARTATAEIILHRHSARHSIIIMRGAVRIQICAPTFQFLGKKKRREREGHAYGMFADNYERDLRVFAAE